MSDTNSNAMSKTVASEQQKLQTVDRDYEELTESYKRFNEAIVQQTMLVDSSGRNGWGVVAPPLDSGERKKKRRCVVS
jgi:hypothetical protein